MLLVCQLDSISLPSFPLQSSAVTRSATETLLTTLDRTRRASDSLLISPDDSLDLLSCFGCDAANVNYEVISSLECVHRCGVESNGALLW